MLGDGDFRSPLARRYIERGAERGYHAVPRMNRKGSRGVYDAINNLPPRCREVFVLRRFHDLSPDDIAKRLGISRNMVEKHLRSALD